MAGSATFRLIRCCRSRPSSTLVELGTPDSDWLTTLSTAALTFIALPDMLAIKRSLIAGASTQRRSRTTGN